MHVDFNFSIGIWGWHTDGLHPDPVMAWLESRKPPPLGTFDMTDAEMSASHLFQDGEKIDMPGWCRLLPAALGGYDPNGEGEVSTWK